MNPGNSFPLCDFAGVVEWTDPETVQSSGMNTPHTDASNRRHLGKRSWRRRHYEQTAPNASHWWSWLVPDGLYCLLFWLP